MCVYFVTECRRVLIIGDSITKDIGHTEGVTLESYPSSTIGNLLVLISNGDINLTNHDFLIVRHQ